MGYYFIENKPQAAHLCIACVKELALAALLRYRQENPEATGEVNIDVNTERRVVVINHIPCAEYTFIQLGITPC